MNVYMRLRQLEAQIGKTESIETIPTTLTLYQVGKVIYMYKNGGLVEWDNSKKSTDIILIKTYLTKDGISV